FSYELNVVFPVKYFCPQRTILIKQELYFYVSHNNRFCNSTYRHTHCSIDEYSIAYLGAKGQTKPVHCLLVWRTFSLYIIHPYLEFTILIGKNIVYKT